MTTLCEIARLAGVSLSVASRALNPMPDKNARVAIATRKRIVSLAKKHNYRPNRSAEFLRRGTAAAISAFVPRLANRLCADLVIGISEVVATKGFSLNLGFGLSLRSFRDFVALGNEVPHSGIITYPYQNAGTGIVQAMNKFQAGGGKILILQPLQDDEKIPALSIDEKMGGRIVAEHLLQRDCKCLYTFGYYPIRIEEFGRIAREAGIKVKNLPGDSSGIQRIKVELHRHRSIGIFAAADHFALDLYRAFPGCIGRELLLVGYDDMLLMDKITPALTTVHQPMRKLGERASYKIIKMIYGSNEHSEMIQPHLMVRESA